jgi:hypothetical protein
MPGTPDNSPFADTGSSAHDNSIIKDSDAHDHSQGYSHNDSHDYNAQDDSPVTDTENNTGQLDYYRRQPCSESMTTVLGLTCTTAVVTLMPRTNLLGRWITGRRSEREVGRVRMDVADRYNDRFNRYLLVSYNSILHCVR